MSAPRPCGGSNTNVCVAEGCYGEACIHRYVSEREQHDFGFLVPGYEAREERARILALLDSADLLEDMAHAHYRSQMPAVDDWAEGTDMWRDLHRDDMQAALDVLRARIEEDR